MNTGPDVTRDKAVTGKTGGDGRCPPPYDMAAGSCPGNCALASSSCGAMPRRAFLWRSILAAAGSAVVVACGDAAWTIGPGPSLADLGDNPPLIPLSQLPELDHVGGIATVPVNEGFFVAIARTGDADFKAVWMTCPHQGTTVIVRDGGFLCPNHGARFASDGTWIGGNQTANLRPVPLTYDAAARLITLGVWPPSTPPRKPMLLTVVLAEQSALAAVGGIAEFGTGNGYPAFLVRVAQEQYLALSPICPHLGYYVDIVKGAFECPGHHATFSATGVWTGGQPTTNLVVLDSTYDQTAGTVTITIP